MYAKAKQSVEIGKWKADDAALECRSLRQDVDLSIP
jgi:hypothetical protein